MIESMHRKNSMEIQQSHSMIVTKNCDIRPRPVQFPRAAEEAENDTGHNIVEAELALDVAE